MDICTISPAAMFYSAPAIGCLENKCSMSSDGKRQLCLPMPCRAELPPLQWTCKSPDGTEYSYVEPSNGVVR